MFNFNQAFKLAYVDAMLWADSPDDETWERSMISPELLDQINKNCDSFQVVARSIIDAEPVKDTACFNSADGWRANQAGHDFWLTRQGHGAGFWDGDWPEQGDALTAICEDFGHVDIYKGDDGKLYS